MSVPGSASNMTLDASHSFKSISSSEAPRLEPQAPFDEYAVPEGDTREIAFRECVLTVRSERLPEVDSALVWHIGVRDRTDDEKRETKITDAVPTAGDETHADLTAHLVRMCAYVNWHGIATQVSDLERLAPATLRALLACGDEGLAECVYHALPFLVKRDRVDLVRVMATHVNKDGGGSHTRDYWLYVLATMRNAPVDSMRDACETIANMKVASTLQPHFSWDTFHKCALESANAPAVDWFAAHQKHRPWRPEEARLIDCWSPPSVDIGATDGTSVAQSIAS